MLTATHICPFITFAAINLTWRLFLPSLTYGRDRQSHNRDLHNMIACEVQVIYWSENLNAAHDLEILGVCGRIILKWALKKQGGSDSSGPRYRRGAGACRHGNEPSVSTKSREILAVWETNDITKRFLLHGLVCGVSWKKMRWIKITWVMV
jgi:hypothetical protein